MANVTHNELERLFPGIEDHTAVEILKTDATAAEVEAALLLLQDVDDDLIGIQHDRGDRLNRLLEILGNAGMLRDDERD